MKVKTIEYSELKSTGNFSNIKFGLTIELSDGEKPSEAFAKARAMVRAQFGASQLAIDWSASEVEQARAIINDPMQHPTNKIEWAKKVIGDCKVIADAARGLEEYDIY